jgi:hairy and enhancer of split protein 1
MTKMSPTSVDPRSIEIPKRPAHKSASEHRKATKPIMEKRRRARINQSLNQLKNMMLEQLQQPESKAQKLEKADILEMTVKYLQRLQQKQQVQPQQQQQPELLLNKFRAGFRQCRLQVGECFRKMQLQPALADRLTTHLAQFEHQQLVQLASSTGSSVMADPRQPLNLTISSASSVQSPPPSPVGSCSGSIISSSGSYAFAASSLSPASERSLSPATATSVASNDSQNVWRPW